MISSSYIILIIDFNECCSNNGGCSHRCQNSYGSYTCSCWSGYYLDDNGHDCIG